MDAVAFVYVFWMAILFILSRRMKARVWWLYVIFLSVVLPVEYASLVGLPPSLCIGMCRAIMVWRVTRAQRFQRTREFTANG